MKKITLLFLSTFYLSLFSQDFFDNDNIQTIEITFSQTNWDDILDTYYAAGSEFRLVGTATLNGEVFDSVGVRYKGNSTYDPSSSKNPLNIKLDYIKGKQKINGRNVLKLSNVFKDPSFVREVLSYEIARKYLPSSKSNYAKVYINGTYIGLYVNDESTNLAFAQRHYYKSNNAYFEAEIDDNILPSCPSGTPIILGYLGSDTSCYKRQYTIQSNNNNDWFQLVEALDTFHNGVNIDDGIYIDRLLWMLAFSNVLVNLDAPINFGHNFLLYKDKTDRFNPIIWDLNESFGAFKNIIGPGNIVLNNSQLQNFNPWFNATNNLYPILSKPFENDRFKKMYIAKMKTIFEENINNNLYYTRANELQNLISTAVSNDANKFYTTAEFSQNLDNSVSGIIGLKELMDGRKTYLNAHSDFVATPPEIANISHSPEEVHSSSSVTISAEISNTNYVYLGYRFSPKRKFEKIQMTASGSTYSATINVDFADVQYYIWAENNEAGVFSPARAEYEFHRIGVTSDIVINEIQASNKTTQFDEAVEYDDWVELYNNTEFDIDLTGYFLSDNKDTLTKWQVPALTIPAKDYVIFWTDKDESQGVNHTNFQLTRNGESFYLVNPSGEIIDQITYPFLTTDLSYSRYPNGRGAFIEKEPTFKAHNGGEIIDAIKEFNADRTSVSLFPNPSENIISLYSNSKEIENSSILIYDLAGKSVFTTKWKNKKSVQIDISKLNKGMYFVKIRNISLKFVKL